MELGEVHRMGRAYRRELQSIYRQDTGQKATPEQSYKSCLGVLHLTKKVGNTRLDNAWKRALDYGAYNYNIIERILKNGWDSLEEDIEQEIEMPDHNNIRGGHYYK